MPLQATSGTASYDAFGGGVVAEPNYIESCFSTYLYTGTGSAQTITNGIDLSTKGGLVWCKSRSSSISHGLSDTVTGRTKALRTNNFASQVTTNDSITSFNNNGFSLGTDLDTGWFNTNLDNYVSWTLRKQPKFFDVVTWTGSGSNRTIAHSLGSVPACIIVKRRDDDADWQVYHRSLANTEYLVLNSTDPAKATGATRWNSTTPTSAVFSLGTDASVNASGGTYVAYLFAHNAGGFGLSGTDNVISCGSFTTNGSGVYSVNLGYEPQWVMIKRSSAGALRSWFIYDNMRGMPASGAGDLLQAHTSGAEFQSGDQVNINATGFFSNNIDGQVDGSATYIYIAIRRGPMKVPTSGTSVFKPNTTSAAAGTVVTTNFPVDLEIGNFLDNSDDKPFTDRLRGYATSTSSRTGAPFLNSPYTNAETTSGAPFSYNWWNTSVIIGNYISEYRQVSYYFGRAPSFFDEVCYTGTEVSGQTFNHNLGAMPEMMIVKARSGTTDWTVYHSALGASARIYLNATNAANTGTAAPWNSTAPTSTVFSLGDAGATNLSGTTFVNYLFATCAGVSKVGSYTGTGTTLQINCGFTGGARFVLIKRTDSTGSWYVWDSSRGIVSGNDPYLLLNSTAAEVTNTDYIDTYSAGFEISSTAPAEINASGGSFIFLAIS